MELNCFQVQCVIGIGGVGNMKELKIPFSSTTYLKVAVVIKYVLCWLKSKADHDECDSTGWKQRVMRTQRREVLILTLEKWGSVQGRRVHLSLEDQIEDWVQGILALKNVTGNQERKVSKKLRGEELYRKKSFYLLSIVCLILSWGLNI